MAPLPKRRRVDGSSLPDGRPMSKDLSASARKLETRQLVRIDEDLNDVPERMTRVVSQDVEIDEDIVENRLRFVDVLTEIPNGDAEAATELAFADRKLTEVESLESCKNVRKLEFKGNHLSDLSFLEMNHQLCWLGLARNRLDRLTGLQNLASLAVLDLSDNRLARLDGLDGLKGLKALIVARNRLRSIEGLSRKRNPVLETLVLSDNKISEVQLAPFPGLKKLSLGKNQLHAFPALPLLPQLTELRLNGNRIGALTADVAKQPRLSILDIGNNLLSKAEAMEPLRGLLWIKSLSLLGNPVAQDMENKLMKGLLDTLPRLQIVNNRRLPQGSQLDKKGRRRCFPDSASNGSKASVAPPPKVMAVHGRGFDGKRSVFADDSENETDIKGKQLAASSGEVCLKATKRKKRKVRKEVEPEAFAPAELEPKERKPKVKRKAKRRMMSFL